MTIDVKAYDHDVIDNVFDALFRTGNDRPDGLTEIPAASYQLIVSALEYITWELTGPDRDTIKKARGIVEGLRDKQKRVEWSRN